MMQLNYYFYFNLFYSFRISKLCHISLYILNAWAYAKNKEMYLSWLTTLIKLLSSNLITFLCA